MRQINTLLKIEKRRIKITNTISNCKKLKFKDKTLIARLLMLCDEFSMTHEERESLAFYNISTIALKDKR